MAVATLTLSVAGCGSTEPASQPPGSHNRLRPADVVELISVSPAATGWTWVAEAETTEPMDRRDIETYVATYPVQETLRQADIAAGIVERRETSWWDVEMKGSLFATLYETADGARDALAAGREFAHGWATGVEKAEIRDVPADDLGERSWAVQSGTSEAGFVEIGWQRGNAVFAVYLSCLTCPSDVAQAALRWADAVDAKALSSQ